MQQQTRVISSLVRRVMKGATEEELLEATENLRRYLKALYSMFLRAELDKRPSDSALLLDDDKMSVGASERATPSMKTYFAYIRVSTVRQGQFGSSLQEQRDAIVAFAQRQGLVITEWFEDRETAAKSGRTQFVRMMTALEKGRAAGLILHKIDRGARNMWDWARIQRLLDAGLDVRFVHDNLDMTSRGGRLAADIQAVVAADYVRNLRDEVRKGLKGRLKQGLYPFRAPIGYLDQGGGKPKTIDPVTGPAIRLAFELYATRQHSLHTLRHLLVKHGLSKRGKALHPASLALILHNPFYIGLIHIKRTGETFAGVHEPLVGVELYRRVQNVLKTKNIETVQHHEFLYRRLLKCQHCTATLIGERQKGIAYYRCHTRGCQTKCIREDFVSRRVLTAIACLSFGDLEIEEMRSILTEEDVEQSKRLEDALRSARLRVGAILERQQRLLDAYVDQVINREEYEGRKAAIHLELAEARENQSRIEQSTGDFSLVAHRFFDFGRRLSYEQACDDAAGFREAVREATSNLLVAGKNLCVTMKSPFKELSEDLAVYFGGPSRCRPRRVEFPASEGERLLSREDYQQILVSIVKHMAGWNPPPFILEEEKRRAPPSQWEKNLRHQNDNDEVREAA